MIRKIYWDFFLRRIRQGQLRWVVRLGKSYFGVLASQAVGKPLCGPILATLVTNYTCNYRCEMCDLPQRGRQLAAAGKQELSTAEMIGVIGDFQRLGVFGIGFTGGEPLLRPDIFELLGSARELGLITHLNTNGSLLNEETAEKLMSVGVDSLNVSLDGADAAMHDGIRGVPGAFARACRGIATVDRLRKRPGATMRLKIVTVLSERNAAHVPALLRLARELGADCSEFIPRQPFAAVKSPGEGAVAGPAAAGILAVAAGLARYKARFGGIENSFGMLNLFKPSFSRQASPLRCFAGYNSIAVDNFGNIYPCLPWLNWGRPVGSLRSSRLQDFWYSPDYAPDRRAVSGCRECTLNCQAELNLLFQPWKLLFARRRACRGAAAVTAAAGSGRAFPGPSGMSGHEEPNRGNAPPPPADGPGRAEPGRG